MDGVSLGVQGMSVQPAAKKASGGAGGGGAAAAAAARPAGKKAAAPRHTAKKADRMPAGGADDAFLSRVKLNETDNWCYHEGSYSHNPEYGSTHTLTAARKSDGGAHTKTDYEDNIGNVRRSEAEGVETFWRIHTTGESQVPESVSRTGAIGHSHEVKLEGDKLTVTVHYLKEGRSKTTELSVAALWKKYRRTGKSKKKVEFKY